MHGSSFEGDCATLLRAMADVYAERYGCASADAAAELPAQALPGHDAPVGVAS